VPIEEEEEEEVIKADTKSVYCAVRAKYLLQIRLLFSVMVKHLAMKMYGEETYSFKHC
jgi:hypothetical protein